jgi:hypothetical protein
MLTTTTLTPTAVEIVAEGELTRADITRVLADVALILETTDQLDLLADVRGPVDYSFGIFAEEMKHLPELFRIVRALGRVAVIADESWIRTVAKVESKLIPGVDYEVYPRAEAAHAREWLLRHTDVAHQAG